MGVICSTPSQTDLYKITVNSCFNISKGLSTLKCYICYMHKTERSLKKIILLYTLWIIPGIFSAQGIFRFEHFNIEDGLSQSTVSSILCDKNGFLWIGTMNGLNRYDGYNFKIYKGQTIEQNAMANNRVTKLWQDNLGFIWLETYDHFFHFFNPKKEVFKSIPYYNDPGKNNIRPSSSFLQYSDDEVWIGTVGNGIYYLTYDAINDTYSSLHIIDKGRYTITNNYVQFIFSDQDGNIWVGTKKGVNLLQKKDLSNKSFNFQHLLIDYSFNAVIETEEEIWFATVNNGIVTYNKKSSAYHFINSSNNDVMAANHILNLYLSPRGEVLVATNNNGLAMYNPVDSIWKTLKIHGKNVNEIYFDRFDNAWVTTEALGVTRISLKDLSSETYQLTEMKQRAVTDRERHVFYEDKDSNFWIGLHGGGLALYNRSKNSFAKYVNDPTDPYSISSNIIPSITEDITGQMWLGTGQYKGGLEKVVMKNPAFQHLLPIKNIEQITDNIVRALAQDINDYLWLATKSGELFIYDVAFNKLASYGANKPIYPGIANTNIYAIFFDNANYVWLGTKGKGLFVSRFPLTSQNTDYRNIEFINYKSNTGDTTSLPDNNIYSIEQDVFNNIWIGTFGNGICVTSANPSAPLKFRCYNSENSLLSNNLVRKIKADSDTNLWVATSFGLNVLLKDSIKGDNIKFNTFFKNINKHDQINYNDIVEIYEDSQQQLWFGTFGGGVSKLALPISDTLAFTHVTSNEGLSNDVVFGILEDRQNGIWLSTEYGLNLYNEKTQSIEIFNESNGLSFNNFSESTYCRLKDGRLVFGGTNGAEIITPGLIDTKKTNNNTELTNFQLFNQDVVVAAKNSPLKESISFTQELNLSYKQNSFSIGYSALDYLDPGKIQYAFILEGFDEQWNYVGNQTKATFTNLPHGSYKFKVKNTNRSGGWKDTYRVLNINILPPWWKTWWAYLIYLLLLIALLIIVRSIVTKINHYRNDLVLEKKINELKLRFFTNISHEIRTPLTLILGPLEDILHENSITEDIKRQLTLMRNNTKRMLLLVNQLLDFRRIQNNKMTLKVREVDLNKFTQNIFNSFIPLAKHNGITFKFNADEEAIIVWADLTKLDSIIYNLISNALKYTPRGKKVSISVQSDRTYKLAKVIVTDQGPGIPNENISDIFTRYVILNNKNNMSTGIGLSLAYELAKLHAGDIQLSSEVGGGSSFCFSIPLNRELLLQQSNVITANENQPEYLMDHEEEFTSLPDYLDKNTIDADLPTILIVEDNAQIASYVKNKISTFYNCFVANNGVEGLSMAEEHNPDVIVSDVMMPQMDGIEMIKKLKENFATCHIPIVLMTAKTDLQDQISGFETGAEAYITKPINSSYLIAVISSLIKQRKLVISKYRDNKTIDPKTLKVNSKDEVFMQQLLGYVEKNYSLDLSVENVAEHCCVSRTVLYNKVKGLTGISPLEFIRQIKIKIALELLRKGYTVSDAAFKIGYSDVKYFSKQFKMIYGYVPSKVKKGMGQ